MVTVPWFLVAENGKRVLEGHIKISGRWYRVEIVVRPR